MVKYIFNFILLIIVCNSIYAQVGINTESPQATLDINGTTNLRSGLNVGNSTDPQVSAGQKGYSLVSQGPGKPPVWMDLNLTQGNISSGYIPLTTISLYDEDGVTISRDPLLQTDILESEVLSSKWSVIDGLTTKFTVPKDSSKLVITLQTTAQSGYNISGNGTTDSDPQKGSSNWLDLVGGIFLKKDNGDPLLITGRQDRIISARYPQIVFSLFYAIENLEKGDYEITTAFRRLSSSSLLKPYPLYIGTPGNVTISNGFMNRSYLRLDIYESANN